MRVIVDFNNDVNWSFKKIGTNKEKLDKYLLENEIGFYSIPSIDNAGYDRFLIEDVDEEDFMKVYTYITNNLHATPKCIHLIYQILSVNGEGAVEAIYESDTKEIDSFSRHQWHKRIEFPEILVINENKGIEMKESERLLNIRCFYCDNPAEYIASGYSLCNVHFRDWSKIREKQNKEAEEKYKQAVESVKKQTEENKKALKEIEAIQKTLSQKPKPREKQEMYRT